MDWEDRIRNYDYVTKFPRSLFIAGDGRVVGTFIMGNNYKVTSGYYGGYPAGYLKRIAALFPDRKRVLHLFSGKVDTTVIPGDTVDYNEALNPTFLRDASSLDGIPLEYYDLILADPPYSVEDALHYGAPMINRSGVIKQLARGVLSNTYVVWLDQALPMYRADEWRIEAAIGMMRSTNHRFRLITIFKRL